MTLFSILAALLWDFFRPLRDPAPHVALFVRYTQWLRRYLDTGREEHGTLAWAAAVLPPALATAVVGALLGHVLGLLEWGWNLLVLYLCMGFRHLSLEVADLVHALWHADREQARRILVGTFPSVGSAESEGEIATAAAVHTLRQSVARLFGVLFWFALLGPFGAVAYRLTALCRDQWQDEAGFCACAGKLGRYLDWLPVRAAAFSFAIVGNFEDTLKAWREQAQSWGEDPAGVLLAAASGTLGVRLDGVSGTEAETVEPPGPDDVAAAVNLVWRTVALWLAVLGLLWLGGL